MASSLYQIEKREKTIEKRVFIGLTIKARTH